MASHGVPRVSGGAADVDKSEQAKGKRRKAIDAYSQLVEEVKQRITAHDYSNTTLQLTSKLLTQNPEYYTIWNYRRLILQDVFAQEISSTNASNDPPSTTDILAAQTANLTLPQREIQLLVTEDLAFLIPLLKSFPKCYWIWNHRAWLLATATTHLPPASATQLWRTELGLVGKMLALDSRNFHGWGYRREVIAELERLSVAIAAPSAAQDAGKMAKESLVETEFAYTTQMITTNLSNFSAWHYRGQILPRLLASRDASAEERTTIFDEELALITRALYTDPYDQSLWFYHQYLISTLEPGDEQIPGGQLLRPLTSSLQRKYLAQEIENVREMLDGAEDSKYIYQALLEYAWQYRWIPVPGKQGEGEEVVSREEMRAWLSELRKLDRLREGRWTDWEKKLDM